MLSVDVVFEEILKYFSIFPEILDSSDRLHEVKSLLDLVKENTKLIYSPWELCP